MERRHRQAKEIADLQQKVTSLTERIAKWRRRVGFQKTSYAGEITVELLPLRMFLLRQSRIRSVKEIADLMERDESQIRKHIHGYFWESDCRPVPVYRVSLGLVDEYLIRLDAEERLEDLYPEIDTLLNDDGTHS